MKFHWFIILAIATMALAGGPSMDRPQRQMMQHVEPELDEPEELEHVIIVNPAPSASANSWWFRWQELSVPS